MVKLFIIRAGRNSMLLNEFMDNDLIAIAFSQTGDLSGLDLDDINYSMIVNYGIRKYSKIVNRFVNEISLGDYVIVYDSENRIYHFARISSDYFYSESDILSDSEFKHFRKVEWIGEFFRDDLSTKSRRSLTVPWFCAEIKSLVKDEIFDLLGELIY